MKVSVLGSTGSVGRHLVPMLVAAGHSVTVLVRDPGKLVAPELRVIGGDALDAAAVDRAAAGQDAVIQTIGRGSARGPTTLFSDSTRILLEAMKRHGVRRLIAVTGIGAGDSKGHGGFVYDRFIYPLFTKHSYIDKTRQEELIRASDLDWIIVRPASFTDGPRRGNLRVATDLRGVTIAGISRADVAAFVLDQLTSDRYLRQTPLIGY